MPYREFLRRILKDMNSRFIGLDVRLLPFLGVAAVAASVAFWWRYRWSDWLALVALLGVGVLWTRSAYADWARLYPLEKAAKFQRNNPVQFLSARFDHLLVNNQDSWVSCEVVISSRLQYEIALKRVYAIIWVPFAEGFSRRFDLKTNEGDRCGTVSGEAGRRDLSIGVHGESAGLSRRLLDYIGNQSCDWVTMVNGKVILTTTELQEITIDVPESSVIATIGGAIITGDVAVDAE